MDEEPNEAAESKEPVKADDPEALGKKDSTYNYYVTEADDALVKPDAAKELAAGAKVNPDELRAQSGEAKNKTGTDIDKILDTAGSTIALQTDLDPITNLPPSIDELNVAQFDAIELQADEDEPSVPVTDGHELGETAHNPAESSDIIPVEQKPAESSERVPIEAAIGFGYEYSKNNFFLLMAVSVLYALVLLVPFAVYSVVQYLVYKNYFLLLCLSICPIVVFLLYHLGRIKASLRLNRAEAFNADDFVSVAPLVLNFILLHVCRSFLTGCAYFAFIVPGVLVQTRLDFAEYFIVDRHQNAFQAIASSWRVTRNSTMMLVLFSITCAFIDVLGLLACLIGGIPARWMTSIARAYVYDRLCQTCEPGSGDSPHTIQSATLGAAGTEELAKFEI